MAAAVVMGQAALGARHPDWAARAVSTGVRRGERARGVLGERAGVYEGPQGLAGGALGGEQHSREPRSCPGSPRAPPGSSAPPSRC